MQVRTRSTLESSPDTRIAGRPLRDSGGGPLASGCVRRVEVGLVVHLTSVRFLGVAAVSEVAGISGFRGPALFVRLATDHGPGSFDLDDAPGEVGSDCARRHFD